ncbi:CMRF35-like molecule 5 isoform X2 [Triplophysa dalaica]|uniref:CMRF35-like molecule 5 isoform X2 n=1 Tax=Triplophysa dalaica TaxID=1582913 RepID=UPI0024E0340E|nr:CMRF35-like molecule 5 isoform X2 [Triplophysa dalaica]
MSITRFIFIILWLISGAQCKTDDELKVFSVQTGGSLTIPCHYDTQYIQQKKYWCYHAKGEYKSCSVLASANETKGRVSVIDHPDQSLFTVTMTNLQDQDSGKYWCVVEIKSNQKNPIYVRIQSVPDVSVVSSSVSGDEGGNISVKCLYSSAYKNKHKHWCRYKDKSCYSSQSSSVEISDDERESFTVLMSGLMLSDSGWYFCSVGDRQAPVQLTVTCKAHSIINKTEVNTDTDSTRDLKQYGHLRLWHLLVVLLLLLLLITIVITTIILRNKHKRNNTHITHEKPDTTSDTDDSVNPECDVTYSSVIKLHQTKAFDFI